MLPLLIAMGIPLFAIIGYALFQPSPAVAETAGKGREEPMEYVPPMLF
jgi:hypothetical protein